MESADVLPLSTTDRAVLEVLVGAPGKVLGRGSILRLAGLDNLHIRRCDSAIVNLRKTLGPDAIVTVRRRGWMLTPEGHAAAVELLGNSAG